MSSQGTSLAAQWLRHKAPSGRVQGSVPGQGTRSDMLQLRVPILQLDQRPHTLQLRPGTAKYIYVRACMLSHFSCVPLCATLWTAAHQALLSMVFFRQEYWSGSPSPPPGDLPDIGIEPAALRSPALVGKFFTTSTTWEAPVL